MELNEVFEGVRDGLVLGTMLSLSIIGAFVAIKRRFSQAAWAACDGIH